MPFLAEKVVTLGYPSKQGAVLRPHPNPMETKSGTPKELKISLSHGL